jgi:hypothetical protein
VIRLDPCVADLSVQRALHALSPGLSPAGKTWTDVHGSELFGPYIAADACRVGVADSCRVRIALT